MRFRIRWKSLRSIGVASCLAAGNSFVSSPRIQLLTKCDSANTPDSRDENKPNHTPTENPLQRLASWCKRTGIKIDPRVSVSETATNGRGVFVTGDTIRKGSSIMTIPVSMVITADNIEEDPQLGLVMGPLRAAGLDDRGAVAL
jgi:hypothetical protein